MDFFSGENLTTLGKTILSSAATFLPHALAAILIIVAGVAISRRAARGTARLLQRPGQVDPALRFIAAELVRYGTVAVALVVALSQLGIASTSLLAVIGGAAGLAIGLSLQGTLSNIAAGLMLLWLRPFHIGDYIEVNNVPNLAGSVSRMGLFTCQLEAFDGLFLFVPNSALWNVPLRNYTRNAGRLISLGVTIPESVPVNQARRILLEIANADHRIADSPKPLVFVERCTIDSVLLNFRVWAAQEHIGSLQRDLLETVKEALNKSTIGSGPVLIGRNFPIDTDPTRLIEGERVAMWHRPKMTLKKSA